MDDDFYWLAAMALVVVPLLLLGADAAQSGAGNVVALLLGRVVDCVGAFRLPFVAAACCVAV